MAQQFKGNEAARPIKRAGVIRPNDPVTVYATELTGKSKSNDYKAGDAFEVHSALAEKLIAAGKASPDAPAKKGGK